MVNGRIHTMDAHDTVNEALAVANGRILKTGTREEIEPLRGPATRMIDLAGRAVYPGFVDAAMHLYEAGAALAPKGADEGRDRILDRVLRAVPAAGVTMLAAAETDAALADRLLDLHRRGGLPVRVDVLLDARGLPRDRYRPPGCPVHPNARTLERSDAPTCPGPDLRLAGISLPLDGDPAEGKAFLRDPYANRPGVTGKPAVTADYLRQTLAEAARHGLPVALRAWGDAAVGMALDEVQKGKGPVRLEAPGLIADSDLDRLSKLKIPVVLFPSATSGLPGSPTSRLRLAALGPNRLASRAASLLRRGIRPAAGTGAPRYGPLNLLAAMAMACRPGPEALTPPEALRLLTIDAARALGRNAEIGSLEPGKRADLVILQEDPARVPPEKWSDIRVDMTWMDGKATYTSK